MVLFPQALNHQQFIDTPRLAHSREHWFA